MKRRVKSFSFKMVSTSTPIFSICSRIPYTSPTNSCGGCWEPHICTESREPFLTGYIHVHFEWINTHPSSDHQSKLLWYCIFFPIYVSSQLNPLVNPFTNYQWCTLLNNLLTTFLIHWFWWYISIPAGNYHLLHFHFLWASVNSLKLYGEVTYQSLRE